MSAITTKPRASSKRKPKAESPSSVFAVITAGLRSASEMLDQARDIGDEGDLGERALRIAHDLIAECIGSIAPTNSAMRNANDMLFDAEGVLCGVAAMHKGDGRGLLSQSVIDTLESLFPHLDQPGFWPDAPEPISEPSSHATVQPTPALPVPHATADWNGAEMEDIDSTISEAIAVMRSRGEEANSSLLYGAVYAAQHARAVLSVGLEARSRRECENASAPIGAASAVLFAALQDFDDQALHGAWRLLDLAHSRLDAAVN